MTYAMKGEIEQSSVRKESDLALFARRCEGSDDYDVGGNLILSRTCRSRPHGWTCLGFHNRDSVAQCEHGCSSNLKIMPHPRDMTSLCLDLACVAKLIYKSPDEVLDITIQLIAHLTKCFIS